MRTFTYRILITCINILFPPISVAMLAGLEWDCILNCILFICAVLPSHVHGFYISCVYFHRRKKVKKGRYPGGPKYFITSENVLNGGASKAEVDRLWRKENGIPERKASRRSRSREPSGHRSRQGSKLRRKESYRPLEMAETQGSQLSRSRTNRSRRPGNDIDEHLMKDGYGEPQRMLTTRSHASGNSALSPQLSNSRRGRFKELAY